MENLFWSKVEKTDGCWNWKGYHTPTGYSRFSPRHNVRLYAHRFAYELTKGKIPKDKELDHLCRNRGCVNPQHLEAVTHGENLLRGDTSNSREARQTHCKWGHPLVLDNLVLYKLYKLGKRECRTCDNLRQRRRYDKMRVRPVKFQPSFKNQLAIEFPGGGA